MSNFNAYLFIQEIKQPQDFLDKLRLILITDEFRDNLRINFQFIISCILM